MRLRRRSLRRIFSRCRFTVAGLIPRVEAISRLVIDCETSASTRSSVRVKTAADRRAFTTKPYWRAPALPGPWLLSNRITHSALSKKVAPPNWDDGADFRKHREFL